MKSYKKKKIISEQIDFSYILKKLLIGPIKYDNFLELLEQRSDGFFENSNLEFELLLMNGLPLDIKDDYVYLKTTNTNISEQTFCFVDIETNGSDPNKGYQIIELGAIKWKNGQVLDEFNSLVFAKEIPQYVQEVTNINIDMLKDAPSIQKVLENFKNFLSDDVFVAHDIKFDYNFISQSFENYDLGKLLNRKLCTIELAKRTIESEKYGLSSLKELLKIEVENHHRAYYDALSTKIIFENCLNNINKNEIRTVEDLIKFSKSDNILNNNLKLT